jgi:hypothetical protein
MPLAGSMLIRDTLPARVVIVVAVRLTTSNT